MKDNALTKQVDGSHYKSMAMQPVELITLISCSFIQGSIIKYVSRYKNKNGKRDIEKAIHFAELAIQLNDRKRCKDKTLSMALNMYITKNKLPIIIRKIITRACYNNYQEVIRYCTELLLKEYPEHSEG